MTFHVNLPPRQSHIPDCSSGQSRPLKLQYAVQLEYFFSVPGCLVMKSGEEMNPSIGPKGTHRDIPTIRMATALKIFSALFEINFRH